MSKCGICAIEAPNGRGLIDGSVVHSHCLEELRRSAETLKLREQGLLAELRKPLGLLENISAFLFQSRQAEFIATKQTLLSRIRAIREEHESVAARIRLIYDLWPTYPPDWEERQQLVRERDSYSCSQCGVGGRLHLHHIRALSQGGTNKLDNIALLCEDCHKEVHGGRTFLYQTRDGSEATTIEKKITLLNEALAKGKDIRFRYKKPDGTITRRKVTPGELRKLSVRELQMLLGKNVKVEKEGKLCLFGYCHLRQANRTFAVHRMQRIEFD